MKITALFLGLMILGTGFSASAKELATCKVKTNDVGTITGRGATKYDAQEDASIQCFDRHEKLNQIKTGRMQLDEEKGTVVIDTCANIKCTSI